MCLLNNNNSSSFNNNSNNHNSNYHNSNSNSSSLSNNHFSLSSLNNAPTLILLCNISFNKPVPPTPPAPPQLNSRPAPSAPTIYSSSNSSKEEVALSRRCCPMVGSRSPFSPTAPHQPSRAQGSSITTNDTFTLLQI